jgi:hypothetical protein
MQSSSLIKWQMTNQLRRAFLFLQLSSIALVPPTYQSAVPFILRQISYSVVLTRNKLVFNGANEARGCASSPNHHVHFVTFNEIEQQIEMFAPVNMTNDDDDSQGRYCLLSTVNRTAMIRSDHRASSFLIKNRSNLEMIITGDEHRRPR